MKNKNKPKSKEVLKTLLTILLIVIIIFGSLQLLPHIGFKGQTKFAVAKGEDPLIIAHGGAKQLFPENTVYAFEGCESLNVDVLEVDLCLTSDDVLITHHDKSVDRTSNGEGLVREKSYEEILTLNFGYDFKDINGNYPFREEKDEEVLKKLVPITAYDMFEKYGKDSLYILEIKDKGEDGMRAGELLNDLIVQFDLQENVVVASFHEEVLSHFVEIKDKDINLSADMSVGIKFVISNLLGVGNLFSYEQAGLQLPAERYGISLDTKYLMNKINKSNMFVHYWTINDEEKMKELIELGCDGIITDRPDLLYKILQEQR